MRFLRNATDSSIISRFSPSVVLSALSTCRSHVLPKMVTTGAPDATRAFMLGSSEALSFTRRVDPKAASFAFLSLTRRISLKNSISRGFEPGQPPSM